KQLIVESFHNGRGKLLHINPSIKFIQGPRKTIQILFESYVFAKNNTHGNTIYWNCRSRGKMHGTCNARLSTTNLSNGRYKVCISRPTHNHQPPKRYS
ncbi:hypothetical protein KR067_004123, partial [Drosophila pandora]